MPDPSPRPPLLPPLSPIRTLRRGPFLQIGSPWRFEWNTYELPIANLAESLVGLKIIHLTDVHLRPKWWRAYDELLTRIADADADLVLITGDLVEHKFDHRPTLPTAERFCRGLRARHGVYVTLGNHDGDLFAAHLQRFGMQLINRKIVRVDINGSPVELIGVPGVLRTDVASFVATFADRANADQTLTPDPREDVLRLALTHFPDTIRLISPLATDVVFAGHTHGGQVCLPGGFPIIRHDALPRQYCSGVHRFGESWLIVSRGFGFATWEIRAFCPSEVIEVVLARA